MNAFIMVCIVLASETSCDNPFRVLVLVYVWAYAINALLPLSRIHNSDGFLPLNHGVVSASVI